MHNEELNLAWRYIERTDTSVFLTGKAGTGKTTFLRTLNERTPKRMIVLAPTGVAAINAGGVTIHSFFQLDLAPFIPGSQQRYDRYRMSKEKKNIMRSVDLIVIDEISMVRADLLDAVDAKMRQYKDRTKPFGGVQLLLIGDLQQLAPVVKQAEWNLLKSYYDTPFFFSSRALKETNYVTIQLKTVYRQTDPKFVDILNAIRTNRLADQTINTLNSRYIPNFNQNENEGYIRLTTHNATAQSYNYTQLKNINMPEMNYPAVVKGEFPSQIFPADPMLQLKVGAQVMFIKNDPNHRFYNGKIGKVTYLHNDFVGVLCEGETTPIKVDKMEWSNSKYTIDEATKEIKEEVMGTFHQFPLRLAWAITIHKSQGLTFDKAIIDVFNAFAHGQVYVALSRCRSLQGLVLAKPVSAKSLIPDLTVDTFLDKQKEKEAVSVQNLSKYQNDYFIGLIKELFNFRNISQQLSYVCRIIDEHLYRQHPALLEQYKKAEVSVNDKVVVISDRFILQCESIISKNLQLSITENTYPDSPELQDRIKKACNYFEKTLNEIFSRLLKDSKIVINNKTIKKQYDNNLESLTQMVKIKEHICELTFSHGYSVTTYLKDKSISILKFDETKPVKRTRGK